MMNWRVNKEIEIVNKEIVKKIERDLMERRQREKRLNNTNHKPKPNGE